MKEIHQTAASFSIQERVWEKTKQKEEYPQFLKYLLDNGITEELFEMTYETPIEKLEVYGEWIKVRGNEG